MCRKELSEVVDSVGVTRRHRYHRVVVHDLVGFAEPHGVEPFPTHPTRESDERDGGAAEVRDEDPCKAVDGQRHVRRTRGKRRARLRPKIIQ